jgi:hypothetical protein
MENAAEHWRDVVGYEGRYQVSDFGRVRSLLGRDIKVLKPTCNGRHADYLTVELWDVSGKRRQRFVHSLVIRAFRGSPPTSAHRCAHDDGDNQNNSLTNLLWKTMKENMDDRERHGRTARGETSGKAKMTEAQAVIIKSLLADHSDKKIAGLVGVSHRSVEAIRAHRTWKHL